MADIGFGGVLADDMGLGKTVQFIALHLHRRTTAKPTLVVCPVSVVANWHREANRFAPDVEVRRFHGTTRDLADLSPDAIVLTTYGVVRRQAETLAEIEWGLVAADEAQNMKNPVSRTARAMRRLRGEARFALTGTPVENRLLDLWALLDWTTPGLLGSQERFRHEVAIPVERDRDVDATEALSRLVRPFVLRRRKIDPGIAPDLPPKTETDEVVGLTTEQATLYTAMVDEVMEQVEAAEGIARRGLVLKLLGGLKQICNHPAQFLHQPGPLTGRSGKLDAATDIVETITAEDESVLIFTQFVTMGHLLVRHLQRPDRPVEFLHGSVPLKGREEMVDRFQAGDTRILVISLKAGGTGLNLTRATHVVHFDRWWNPAVEDQASDRAWRIGQDRPVQIHRMICEGTVEDKVAQLLTEKRQLAEAVVGTGEAWVGELSDSDLRALVALGADR
jgi:SNF2 family DNA or RNA helicase